MSEIHLPASILWGGILGRSSREDVSSLFHSGEILEGKIVEEAGPGQAIVQMKGRNLLVETRLSLPRGLTASFQVESTRPQVVLRLLPESGGKGFPIPSILKRYLAADLPPGLLAEELSELPEAEMERLPVELRETLREMAKLLRLVSIEDPAAADPSRIRKAILQSGLFFESRLRHLLGTHGEAKPDLDGLIREDLKGLAMALLAQAKGLLTDEDPSRETLALTKALLKGLEHFVHKTELYQVFNLTHSNEGKIFLLIPVWFQERLQFVELNLSLPRRGKTSGEGEELSLLFLLDLPDLGKMKIDVRVREEGLYCSFAVSDQEIADFIEEELGRLGLRLRDLGFQPQIRIFAETLEKRAPTLLSEMAEGGTSMVSIIV